MSSNKLSVLAIVAVASLICAILVNRITNVSKQAPAKSVYLIQGLSPASINTVHIKGDGKEVSLKRTGDTFVVTNKDNYPAQAKSINELLTGLLDIQSLDIQTSDQQNYSELGVADGNSEKLVEFLDKDDKVITGLLFGKRTDNGNSYVRLIDGKEVYLCNNIPYVRTSAIDYTNQQLVNVNKDEVAEVTVTDSNGVTYSLVTEPNSTDIKLAGGLPAGKKLKSNYRQVFTALANMRFNDVMSEKSSPEKLVFDKTYICKLKDSTVYVLKIAKDSGKTYAKFSASFTNNQKITINPDKKESDQEVQKKQAILKARDAVSKFNNTTKGWVYELPSYKADNLTKSLNDILEDIKPDKAENTNGNQN